MWGFAMHERQALHNSRCSDQTVNYWQSIAG